MTIKEFIERAIEGGWRPSSWDETIHTKNGAQQLAKLSKSEILLDPFAWQAVGKVEGWSIISWAKDNNRDEQWQEWGARQQWKHYMHRMIDSICEGKSIEEFLETL